MGLDLYEVYLEVEEEFDIRFLERDVQPIETVGGLYDATLNCLRMQHPERFGVDGKHEERVWEQLKVLLVHQLGLNPEQIVASAHFVRDLGIY